MSSRSTLTTIALATGCLLTVTSPAKTCPIIDRSELNGDQLRIEGQNAQPDATISIDGQPMGTADEVGDFRIEASGFIPPSSCELNVSDGFCTVSTTPTGCTVTGCSSNAECDDGLYCNGAETCQDGTCLTGSDPCGTLTCDEVGDACIGACNGISVPSAGETITWTAAQSPIDICADTVIPVGGTVVVEPGVVIQLAEGVVLTVAGSLIGQGTPLNSITLTGSANFPTRVIVSGTLDLAEAIVEVLIRPDDGGSLIFTDTTFQGAGLLTTVGAATYLWNAPPFIDLNRCDFFGAYLRVDACSVLLSDTTFSNTFCEVGDGALVLDNVSIDGSPFDGLFLYEFTQPLYLQNLAVTNAVGAGLNLLAVNVQIGSNVTLAGNGFPASLGGGGFLPGSALPAIGNLTNHVPASSGFGGPAGGVIWSDTGIPYVVTGAYSGVPTQILPGTTIQLAPAANMWGNSSRVEARGLPGAPVTFERLDPTLAWQGLQRFFRLENCIIDGADIGARFTSVGFPGFIDNCIIRNCDFGTQNNVLVRKTRFINNTTGSWNDDWPGALDGDTGANSFEGNGVAVQGDGTLVDARLNWWNDPSGPTSSDNPRGTGEVVILGSTTPFLNAPPDFSDNPPMVHLKANYFLLEPGSKTIISWQSQDDIGLASHRVEFDHPLEGRTVVADNLPATQRSIEWTVPNVGFIVNSVAPTLRVIAVDTAGQEGWDSADFLIPTGDVQGTLTVTTDLVGPFRGGDDIGESVCWTAEGLNPLGAIINARLFLDADGSSIGLGGVTTNLTCLPLTLQMPFVSTDTARIGLVVQESLNNVKYFFSDYFTIQSDVRLGDEAPAVTMTAPMTGQSFAPGTAVPITWTASDDTGLRSFDIQASYDTGRTWHVIASDLSPLDTSFNWMTPPGTGFPDVRVRVIAKDLRFQNTSDGADHIFAIAGGGANCPGGCDDGLFCNGLETCVAGVCLAGTPPNCDDGVICTDDSCNEDTDSCDNVDDYAIFAPCLLGPGGGIGEACGCFDFDGDGDNDLHDFSMLRPSSTG